ncbi:MAG: hypothetical protein AAFQ07_09930 [Chloroflexota bacterium]
MLFKPELAQAIADLRKNQTRRPRKKGEQLIIRDDKKTIVTAGGRVKHQVGRDYAVPYKYGKPCRWIHKNTCELMKLEDYEHNLKVHGDVSAQWAFHQAGFIKMRIRITDIWQEDVRTISHEDAIAEACGDLAPKYAFLQTWLTFYDTALANRMLYTEYDPNLPAHCPVFLWDEQYDTLFDGWAYKFELLGVSHG